MFVILSHKSPERLGKFRKCHNLLGSVGLFVSGFFTGGGDSVFQLGNFGGKQSLLTLYFFLKIAIKLQ